jgi:hypothetical protein
MEQKDLSVLKNGAPDCPVCHRTVSGALGLYKCQTTTLGKNKVRSAIIHQTVQCGTRLSGEPVGNGYPAPTVDCKSTCHVNSAAVEIRAAKSEGTELSGVAPDCLVPQEYKAPTVNFAPNPNGWVTWRRTRQRTVLKGKCALGPFLSILVIECQHKCLNVNLYSWMNKVQIKSKGMFLSLSTLVFVC